VAIERIVWTEHAERRIEQRGLTRPEVEEAVLSGHGSREINRGDADWRAYGARSDGRRFAVIYDHPALGDSTLARVVSAWPVRNS
jgi:hypothetical protein